MRALLLDVGNTRLKWGVGQDGKIAKTGNIPQQKIREQGVGVLTARLPRNVDAVMASNVAGPTTATRLAGLIGAHCNTDVHFAKTARSAYGLKNSYAQPRSMGVDRWVAMIGAWAELHSACLIVDAGTAVTIDAVNRDGQHLGGQILPGVALMARALATDTSDLPRVTPAKTSTYDGLSMFAGNTRNAIQSGALNAVVGAIERANKTLRSNAYRPKLVLTGGDASRILPTLDGSPLHRPHLVLQGLLHMLDVEHNRSQ
ncbi:MAG: type III pantothenate kinase [Gammaproteobacteria bacterium]|nr:type III pantothenate kinase [Gammaproteobacteria bacterium]